MSDLPITAKHTCGCGHHDEADPELDSTAIPHAVRHAAVLGALAGLRPGASLVLKAPHDPKPLLAQADQQFGNALTREYVQQGPDAWKIRFTRA